MPSAVVGLLRAVLSADTAQFESGMKRGVASTTAFTKAVAGIGTETLKAGSAVERMARGLGGERLLQTANNLTAAVHKLGGVANLTRGEQDRLNATLDKAIQKYSALGQQAPKAMQELHQATKRPVAGMLSLDGVLGKVGATMLATFSVGAIVGAIRSTGQWAGQIDDLSKKMGISVEAVQRLDFAAKQNGSTIDAVGSALAQMSKRLVEGDKSAVEALKKLNFSIDQLRAMAPDQAFAALASAIAQVPNPMERSALAMQLFGRSGADLLPVMGNLEADMSRAVVASEAMVKAGDRVGDAWDKLVGIGKVLLATIILPLEPALTAAAEATGSFAQQMLDLAEASRRVGEEEKKRREEQRKPRIQVPPSFSDRMFAASGVQPNPDIAILNELDKLELERMKAGVKRPASRGFLPAIPDPLAGRAGTFLLEQEIDKGKKQTEKIVSAAERVAEKAKDFIVRMAERAHALGVSLEGVAKAKTDAAFDKASREVTQAIARQQSLVDDFRAVMAVAGDIIPQIGGMPTSGIFRELALENRFGPLSPQMAGFVGALPLLPPTDRRGLPAAMELENIAGPMAPPRFNLSRFLKGGLGDTILGSLMGGGSLTRSLAGFLGTGLTSKLMTGATGQGITTGLTKAFGKTIGSSLAGMIPGLGALIGPAAEKLFGAIGKLFVSEASKTNRGRDSWIKEFTGVDDLPLAQDALRKMAFEAGATDQQVRALFDSRKVKDFEAAQRVILDLLDKHKQKVSDLQALTDAQAQKQRMLKDAVARYGFEVSELGPLMRKQNLAEHAEQLLTDWKLLEEAGFDINTMAQRMAESINTFIHEAIRTGTEVPNAMRPMLDAMIRQGLLTGTNDQLIQDLTTSGITFGETLTEMFKNVLQKLDDLIESLRTAISLAKDAETAANAAAAAGAAGSGDGSDDEGQRTRHRGGIVAHRGRFIGRGGLKTGEVWVKALSGEGFLNRQATAAVGGRAGIDAINRGDAASFLDGLAGLSAPTTAASAGTLSMSAAAMPMIAGGGSDNTVVVAAIGALRSDIRGLMSTLPIEIESAVRLGRARRG